MDQCPCVSLPVALLCWLHSKQPFCQHQLDEPLSGSSQIKHIHLHSTHSYTLVLHATLQNTFYIGHTCSLHSLSLCWALLSHPQAYSRTHTLWSPYARFVIISVIINDHQLLWLSPWEIHQNPWEEMISQCLTAGQSKQIREWWTVVLNVIAS